jgi:GT2 family glycosyltransferase
MTDLSIIIVNYRGWGHLKVCLDALAGYKNTIFKYEVIIVDNNSNDGKLSDFKEKFPKFLYVESRVNGGYAHGCNQGAKNASGEYFLFLNPDTVAMESEVEKLLTRSKEHPEYFITSCSQFNEKGKESKAFGLFPGPCTLTGTGRAIYKVFHKEKVAAKTTAINNVIKPDWVSGSVIMMKRKIFENIRGFDEDFWMYYEDTDLSKRVRDINGEIAYFTDIKIQHNHGGSSRINLETKSLTKTEVLISNHVYISKHFSGITHIILHKLLILNNLIGGLPLALIGLVVYHNSKLFVKTIIYGRLISYYFQALLRRTWISQRSINFKSKTPPTY